MQTRMMKVNTRLPFSRYMPTKVTMHMKRSTTRTRIVHGYAFVVKALANEKAGNTRHPVLLLTAFVAFKSAFGADDSCPNRKPDVGCNLDVSFEDVEVFCNQIPTSSVASAPTIEWSNHVTYSREFFVLLMVDPDAPRPCPAPSGYYLHWLAVASVTDSGVVRTTRTYVNYVPPTPPQGTHRYQLLMYRLSSGSLPNGAMPDRRSGFSLENFKAAVGLQEKPDASFQFLYEP